MARREPAEITVEVPIEPTFYVPGPRADHLAAVRGWWRAAQLRVRATATSSGSGTAASRGVRFRRIVDLPGDQLEPALRAWWRWASHDDGHLRLDWLTRHGGVFELEGSFRTSSLGRRVPVEMQLSPYVTHWSLLELTPRRRTRPSRRFFDTGHDSLDRFVAALCELV